MTVTPDLAAFLMLRRHSWFIPASSSSSVVPASGSWNTKRGWPAAKPSSSLGGRHPSSRSRLRNRVASWLVSSGSAWLSRAIRSSAIAALIVGACQRRTTTGQPIRMPKAPDDRRCSASGVSQSPMSSASHSISGPSGR